MKISQKKVLIIGKLALSPQTYTCTHTHLHTHAYTYTNTQVKGVNWRKTSPLHGCHTVKKYASQAPSPALGAGGWSGPSRRLFNTWCVVPPSQVLPRLFRWRLGPRKQEPQTPRPRWPTWRPGEGTRSTPSSRHPMSSPWSRAGKAFCSVRLQPPLQRARDGRVSLSGRCVQTHLWRVSVSWLNLRTSPSTMALECWLSPSSLCVMRGRSASMLGKRSASA